MSQPDYLISTPENVDLHLELAGLGNRVLAVIIDTTITFVTILIIFVACASITHVVTKLSLSTTTRAFITYTVLGLSILAAMVVNFGYHIFFEGTWRGQSPGKKIAGIRVVEQNGQPVGWASVIIRNLLRVIDTGLAMVGLLVLVADRNERRIGDFAAGTLVIRERGQALSLKSKVTVHGSAVPATGSFVAVGRLTPAEYELILSFLERRQRMSRTQRPLLAKKLENHFRAKLEQQADGHPPERFLESVYAAYNARADVT